jgi:hypothetical protein
MIAIIRKKAKDNEKACLIRRESETPATPDVHRHQLVSRIFPEFSLYPLSLPSSPVRDIEDRATVQP